MDATMDELANMMIDLAKESQGGKIVESEGRSCFKCGKACSEADSKCLAKGFGVHTCNACEPHGYGDLIKALSGGA